MADYKWKPIEPLSDKDRAIDLPVMRPLYESWRAAKVRLKESSPANLAQFNQQLVRSLSIETGILERLYDLDRGTTEVLITHGFAEDLISRSSTDLEPSRLIEMLRDHEAATQLVMNGVSKRRPTTKGVLHELHSTLTKHQDTTTAMDQFGRRVEVPLLKGKFKEQPNNPRRPDGSVHEYCPPVSVDSEIDNLLSWLAEYSNEDPVLVASFVHHRFTQIHPYQDGNGRVGRTLTTLVLLQSDLLPLVIDRDLRAEYLTALETADSGDLDELVRLFARLERNAVLRALSIDTDPEVARDRSLTSAVIENLAAKFSRRREERRAQLRQVNGLAESLRARSRGLLEEAFTALREPVSEVAPPEIHMKAGGPDKGNAHWYKFDVIESGKSSGKFVNFSEAHYFTKASIRVGTERLVFVISIHHVGRELSGIMEVTAFARLESFEDSEEREVVGQDFFPCALEPFVITWKTEENDIADPFDRWLDAGIAVAIKEFGERL